MVKTEEDSEGNVISVVFSGEKGEEVQRWLKVFLDKGLVIASVEQDRRRKNASCRLRRFEPIDYAGSKFVMEYHAVLSDEKIFDGPFSSFETAYQSLCKYACSLNYIFVGSKAYVVPTRVGRVLHNKHKKNVVDLGNESSSLEEEKKSIRKLSSVSSLDDVTSSSIDDALDRLFERR